MIRQSFSVEQYWEVVVYYNIDYNHFYCVANELYSIGASRNNIDNIYYTMLKNKGKAFTYSNIDKHTSIVGFNNHNTATDYINSIVHEAEHIKQAMLKAYSIEDRGEPPAYTIGYLVQRMYKVFTSCLLTS